MKSTHIFDIDGTICSDGGVLLPEHRDILLMGKAQGHVLWFATARHIQSVQDALHHHPELLNTRIATLNGAQIYMDMQLKKTKCFSKSEIHAHIQNLIRAREEIYMIDLWLQNTLITYTRGVMFAGVESRYRQYVSWDECIELLKSASTSMIHVQSENAEYDIVPHGVDKSAILEASLYSGKRVYLYGNSTNDLPLFRTNLRNHQLIRYCIGGNTQLQEYSQICFEDHDALFKHLQKIWSMEG